MPIVIIFAHSGECTLALFLILFLGKHRRNILTERHFIPQLSFGSLFEAYRPSRSGITGVGSLVSQAAMVAIGEFTGGRQRKSTFGFRVFQHGNICGNSMTQPNRREGENILESLSYLLLTVMSALLTVYTPPVSRRSASRRRCVRCSVHLPHVRCDAPSE